MYTWYIYTWPKTDREHDRTTAKGTGRQQKGCPPCCAKRGELGSGSNAAPEAGAGTAGTAKLFRGWVGLICAVGMLGPESSSKEPGRKLPPGGSGSSPPVWEEDDAAAATTTVSQLGVCRTDSVVRKINGSYFTNMNMKLKNIFFYPKKNVLKIVHINIAMQYIPII